MERNFAVSPTAVISTTASFFELSANHCAKKDPLSVSSSRSISKEIVPPWIDEVRLPSTVEKVLNESILKLMGTTFLPSTDICANVDMLCWFNGYEFLI